MHIVNRNISKNIFPFLFCSVLLLLQLGIPDLASCGSSGNNFNIVLISIDTLRADHLSCYGYERPTSPEIDKLAEKSTLFTNATATSPWTAPSMVSLFTSVYPTNHGVVHGLGYKQNMTERIQEVFSEELTTLAEILKNHGYTTFGVASNLHLSEKFGFARGFDYFQCLPFLPAPVVNNTLYAWIKEIKEAKKYFIWMHYFDPHHFYHARSPWIENYSTRELTDKLGLYTKDWIELKKLIPWFKKNPPVRENLIALYDSEINFVDDALGDLIRTLDLHHNTMVIITSDHGEEFLEHGCLGHGQNLHGESINIPLIIKLPYSSKKQTVDKNVSLIDIVPTVLDAISIPSQEYMLGTSLIKERGIFSRIKQFFTSEKISEVYFSETDTGDRSKCIITPQWKYLFNYKDNKDQLYHIKSDPLELKNLAEERAGQSTKLKEQLFEWAENTKIYPPLAKTFQLSPEEWERLKGLGYID